METWRKWDHFDFSIVPLAMKAGERESEWTSARQRIPVTDGCRITGCFFLFLDVKHSWACMCKFLLGQIYCCEKKTEFPGERSFIGQSHAVCQRFHWWTQTEGMKRRAALRPEVSLFKIQQPLSWCKRRQNGDSSVGGQRVERRNGELDLNQYGPA